MKFSTLSLLSVLTLAAALRVGTAAPPAPYATVFTPGTPSEQPYLVKVSGAEAAQDARTADTGQFWVYGFPVAPGARCRLALTVAESGERALPSVTVLGADNKPLPIRAEKDGEDAFAVVWTVPGSWKTGAKMSVVISAKNAPVTVRAARFTQTDADANNDGLPDHIAALMTEGLPPKTPVRVIPAPDRPVTVSQTTAAPDPALDLQTDALLLTQTDADSIASWKARGYAVWTLGSSRENREAAEKNKDEVQATADGAPIANGGSVYLTPTENRLAAESAFFAAALANGSEGVCPQEPEYWAKAGYEPAFKQAWQRVFQMPWQDPAGSVEARWKAGQLAATLLTDHVAGLLRGAQQAKPAARRMLALHSPVSYAQWGILSPHSRLFALPEVQDIIGQAWPGTSRAPVRYAGLRRERLFSLAWLEYSSLVNLARGTNKRLWFLADPWADAPDLAPEQIQEQFEQTLIAALLFPEVDSYAALPWPERAAGKIPASYAVETNSVLAALQDMHRQRNWGGSATASADIGVLLSDTAQWQREAPNPSDLDGFFGLTLPLLQRGVPVQVVSLERAAEPGYLSRFKTLLLSYDFQKPADPRVHAALADWARRGGGLIVFGGADAYNAVSDSWWRQAKRDAPQADLWKQLGLPALGTPQTVRAAQEDASRYQVLLKGDGAERNQRNRRAYTLDLTPFVKETGSVAVRFSDVTPQDGSGAVVASTALRVGDQVAAAFQTGTEIENRFVMYDNGSGVNATGRFADGNASWTYQFDNLPRDRKITLTLDMGNGFQVAAAPAAAQFGHTLLGTAAGGGLTQAMPRLRIGASYPATVYPQLAAAQNGSAPAPAAASAQASGNAPAVLYTLRSGGAAVWAASVGNGLAMQVGVAPGFFSASERSADLLRAITQYAYQRVGGSYRETDSLRLQRGRYIIVRTFAETEIVEGRTIDLFSPTLAVASDRAIPPRSYALLYALGSESAPPHLAFVSGRLQAKVETPGATVFFARGPLNTTGAARLHAGGKRMAGARAMDRLGRPVEVQATQEGSALLLRFPHHPDGVIVRVGWQ